MNLVLGPPKAVSGQATACPSGWGPSTKEKLLPGAWRRERSGWASSAQLQAEVSSLSGMIWGKSLSPSGFPTWAIEATLPCVSLSWGPCEEMNARQRATEKNE